MHAMTKIESSRLNTENAARTLNASPLFQSGCSKNLYSASSVPASSAALREDSVPNCSPKRKGIRIVHATQAGECWRRSNVPATTSTTIFSSTINADHVQAEDTIRKHFVDRGAHQHPDGVVAVGLHQAIEGAAVAQRKISPHLQVEKAVIGEEGAGLANKQHRVRRRQQREKNIQPQRFRLSLIGTCAWGSISVMKKEGQLPYRTALPFEMSV